MDTTVRCGIFDPDQQCSARRDVATALVGAGKWVGSARYGCFAVKMGRAGNRLVPPVPGGGRRTAGVPGRHGRGSAGPESSLRYGRVRRRRTGFSTILRFSGSNWKGRRLLRPSCNPFRSTKPGGTQACPQPESSPSSGGCSCPYRLRNSFAQFTGIAVLQRCRCAAGSYDMLRRMLVLSALLVGLAVGFVIGLLAKGERRNEPLASEVSGPELQGVREKTVRLSPSTTASKLAAWRFKASEK